MSTAPPQLWNEISIRCARDMDLFISFDFLPLRNATESHLQSLCQSLWRWSLCGQCSVSHPCAYDDCSQQRFPRLQPFFNFYKDVTSSYVPESLLRDDQPAIRKHDDLFDIIALLKDNPTVTRCQLNQGYFSKRGDETKPPLINDQHRAFNIGLKILTTVNCCIEGQTGGLLEAGIQPSVWRSDQCAADFISSTFPKKDHPTLNEKDEFSPDIKLELTALKLKKIAGLSFVGTDDLRNHLKLDQKTGVVEMYHYTSVLKEHLTASKAPSDETLSEILPRQLLLETLDSLQKVLFPLEPKSQAFLRTLVSKQGLDPDCLRFGLSSYRHEHENDITYQYWGSRLMDLYDEIENPTPRGMMDVWLEQRSKSRHVMLVTMIGVITAVVLGALGLVVGIFQSWISYQAWKHPATNGGE